MQLKEVNGFEKGTYVNGRYEVQGVIGSGGTSCVYLVADRHIGRLLAMKVMDSKSMGAFRFARSEIESLRCVKYPLFPAIHDAFCDGKSIYILSEYVKGTSLAAMCMGHGLPRDRSLTVVQHICEALDYLHNMPRPLLYLDLKPQNVIITDDGLPHLIDFGIAGWLASRHIPVGTPGYSPPEQYETDTGLDARCDIFALGMTYYCIRCGVPPNRDITKALHDIRHSHILDHIEKAFLEKCCDPDRDSRYNTSREALKQIRHIRSIPERNKRFLMRAAAAVGIGALTGYAVTGMISRIKQNTDVSELVHSATQHMEDGEYTPEGIGIIKACINSRNLPAQIEQEFIFEVALNSMFISKDYRTAAWYFSKLDPAVYPEADDYARLCRLQSSFDDDGDKTMEVIGKLFGDIAKRSHSKMKYENMIFIASCYENYDPDRSRGLQKALSVLRMEKEELDGLAESIEEEGKVTSAGEELRQMRDRIDDLITVKKNRYDTRKKMTGEQKKHEEDK